MFKGGGGGGGGRGRGWGMQPSGLTVRIEYQEGRSAYIPGVEFDGSMPEMGPFFGFRYRFWRNPKNAEQILGAVRWAAKDQLPVTVGGPNYLVANLVWQQANQRELLHLVNYAAADVPSISSVDVTLPSSGKKLASVSVISLDSEEQKKLVAETNSSGIHFRIPEVKTYSVVVLQWQ